MVRSRRSRACSIFDSSARYRSSYGVGSDGRGTPHELRHHYASVLIDGGGSVKVVQERLGHASATETLDTYPHLWPSSDERTRTVVERAWNDAPAERSWNEETS